MDMDPLNLQTAPEGSSLILNPGQRGQVRPGGDFPGARLPLDYKLKAEEVLKLSKPSHQGAQMNPI